MNVFAVPFIVVNLVAPIQTFLWLRLLEIYSVIVQADIKKAVMSPWEMLSS